MSSKPADDNWGGILKNGEGRECVVREIAEQRIAELEAQLREARELLEGMDDSPLTEAWWHRRDKWLEATDA